MKGNRALLIIDLQNDFCAGGSLEVPGGDEVVPLMNQYIESFSAAGLPIFASRDWHPENTTHFKEHGGRWPRHCVRGTTGAAFHPDLRLPDTAIIVSKGMEYETDSYSAFHGVDDQGRELPTRLREHRIERLYVGGLATDYCVKHSVLDALRQGFEVMLLEDAIRGVNVNDSIEAIEQMVRAGAMKTRLQDVDPAAELGTA